MKPREAPAPLPCPFCGHAGGAVDRVLRDGYEKWKKDPDAYAYTVRCPSCAAEGGWAKSASGAVRNWNMRPSPGMAPRKHVTAPAHGLRVIEYMAEVMSMRETDRDQQQNWIARHLQQFANRERRLIRKAIAPILGELRAATRGIVSVTGFEDPTCAKCGTSVSVGEGLEWEDGDLCNGCASDLAPFLVSVIRLAVRRLELATKSPRVRPVATRAAKKGRKR